MSATPGDHHDPEDPLLWDAVRALFAMRYPTHSWTRVTRAIRSGMVREAGIILRASRARITELESALEPFADIADRIDRFEHGGPPSPLLAVREECQAARLALRGSHHQAPPPLADDGYRGPLGSDLDEPMFPMPELDPELREGI